LASVGRALHANAAAILADEDLAISGIVIIFTCALRWGHRHKTWFVQRQTRINRWRHIRTRPCGSCSR